MALDETSVIALSALDTWASIMCSNDFSSSIAATACLDVEILVLRNLPCKDGPSRAHQPLESVSAH